MSPPQRILFCLFSAASLWAQPPVVIQSETRVVLVDAVVTGKKGEYVRDLTAKDFRVWEDNKEQTIQSFSLESTAAASAAPRTSYLVLVFDYADMDAGDQIRARQAAASFIDANTGPERQMALAVFSGGFRIVQGFTGNAGRLKEALEIRRGFLQRRDYWNQRIHRTQRPRKVPLSGKVGARPGPGTRAEDHGSVDREPHRVQ